MIKQALKHQQQGMTAIGWLIVLSVVAFFALIVMRMVPVVMTNLNVETALETLAEDEDVRSYSKKELRNRIQKRLDTYGVEVVTSKELIIELHKGGSRTLKMNYEHRVPFASNIFIVAVFEESVEI